MSSCSPTDRLMQTLRVHVPGATDDLLQLELFNVIDEFMRRTSAWKMEADIVLQDDTYIYDLALPPDSAVVRAMGATHNGVPVASTTSGVVQSSTGTLEPELTFPDGDANYAPFATDIEAATSIFTWSLFKPNYISVTNPPTGDAQLYPLRVILALSIARSCLECDCGDWMLEEWMYDMYFQDWLDGTLGRLYMMPAKPWNDKTSALYHGKRFRSALGYRKQEAMRAFNYNIPIWRFPGGW
jgi:hypothetical protein